MAEEKGEAKGEERVEKVIPRSVEKEMKHSYIDYAMSVIVGRALPDVRDGLKPVHRRILFAMNELGNTSDKPYKKSARIVGEVLGKFHPHGESAVYDTLVRMAQDFSLRYTLIDGQGNFGSVDGDSPAAMRYTECKLEKIAEEMLEDIDKDTVPFVDNFDGTLKEPAVLPAKLPNLLINGSSGIAVGMATNIPPHNLCEVIDATVKIIDNPGTDLNQLMNIVKGPDFPTGGTIYGRKGIIEAYATGRGTISVRAKTDMEGERKIIVTELPYLVNKSELLSMIAELVKEKKIEGITDLRDESDREGMRIVIELKKDALGEIVLNQLFTHTPLESTFGIINLALVNSEPKILNLRDMLDSYLNHRLEVVTKRTEFELKKAEEKAHIFQGLLIALDNIDEVIQIIRKSKTVETAKDGLIAKFFLSEIQAKAILEMRLQKLTGLERESVRKEYEELVKLINELRALLASREKLFLFIKRELLELREKYGDKRRTEIADEAVEIDIEDLIPVQDVTVTMTNAGYVKRIPLEEYRAQRRGGKGLIGMGTKEEDYVVNMFITSTHDYVLFFTNKGRCYWLKAYRIPEESRYARGRAIVNLLPRLEEGERVNAMIPVKEFDSKHYLIFSTKKGMIKKTVLSLYGNPRAKGIIAINLEQGDELVGTRLSDGSQEVVLATKNGLAARFDEKEVRPMGRNAKGVIGIRMRSKDDLVSMTIGSGGKELLTITENGYGKRSPLSSYRKTRRGSKGVITIYTGERNGKVVSVSEVTEEGELIVTSRNGMIIRMPLKDIPVHGRATMGVRIMRLEQGDKVMAVASVTGLKVDSANSMSPA